MKTCQSTHDMYSDEICFFSSSAFASSAVTLFSFFFSMAAPPTRLVCTFERENILLRIIRRIFPLSASNFEGEERGVWGHMKSTPHEVKRKGFCCFMCHLMGRKGLSAFLLPPPYCCKTSRIRVLVLIVASLLIF